MDHDQQIPSADTAAPARKARRPWSPPHLTRIRAGEAELGANAALPEGHFAQGS
jgi:hypothetical protein